MKKYALVLLAAIALMACRREVTVRTTIDGTPAAATIGEALLEIGLAVDGLFEVIDDRRVSVLVTSVTHAARGRLLLEKVLGSDIDNFDFAIAENDRMRYSLILIANQARKFSSQEAADLWLHDLSTQHYSDATGELAILDVMLQHFKSDYPSLVDLPE